MSSIHAPRLQKFPASLHKIWSFPLRIILALSFLYHLLGAAIFGGFFLLTIVIPLNNQILKVLQVAQEKQMKIRDSRLKVLNEIFNGIKVIKMYAWELSFVRKVEEIRNNELKAMRDSFLVQALMKFIWSSAPLLISIVTFGTFVWLGGDLTPEIAFTSTYLLAILRGQMSAFPEVLSRVTELYLSVDRLEDFFSLEERDYQVVSCSEPYLAIRDGSFSWTEGSISFFFSISFSSFSLLPFSLF